MLSEDEIERYARHLILPEIGGAGQQALKQARVLVIGAGGLGCPNLTYLAAAGVGHIGIIDDDIVSLSNLQRQTLYSASDIGKAKAECAKANLLALNPEIHIESYCEKIADENVAMIFAQYDIICDGSDNFETRYLAAKTAEALEKPLVTAAVNRFDGYITLLKPFEKNEKGHSFPRFEDIFPQVDHNRAQQTCPEIGVLGIVTGILGTLQALETIREVTKFGDSLLGFLLLIDLMSMRFEKIKI